MSSPWLTPNAKAQREAVRRDAARDAMTHSLRQESVLEEAARLVAGKRGDDYGHPLDNHGCTSAMFSAYLHRKYGIWVPLDAEDTCIFNVLQKVSREANRPQRDNAVDGAGYFENLQMVRDERARRTV